MVLSNGRAFAPVFVLFAAAGTAQNLAWRAVDITTYSECAAVFDAARERFVAVSGTRTLEWDGVTWQLRPVTTRHPSRFDARLVYDRARQRTLMVGGWERQGTAVGLAGSIWQYDGSGWTESAPVGPSPRARHALAYDAARQRVVLFGGAGAGHLGDTWEWDGVSWHQAASAVSPTPRVDAAMAFHAPTGRTILFGGTGMGQPVLADTWAWDGSAWTQLAPATVPAGRQRHSMAAGAAHAAVVMHGGRDAIGAWIQDTWEWNGTDWALGTTAVPPPRHTAGVASDDAGNTILVGGVFASHQLGGVYEAASLGDTWRYGGGGQPWVRIEDTGPPYRNHPYLAYDPVRDRLVLAGGSTGTVHHTWEWDGAAWHRQTPTFDLPMLAGAAMAFDSIRGVAVVFGGISVSPIAASDRTYEWNGVTWIQAPGFGPSARHYHAMAFDRARGVMVLFGGGNFLGDTWTWDGTTWTQVATTGPSGRLLPAMAYDEARARVVLFGGMGPAQLLDDTWEWDGVGWQQVFPAHSPSPRHSTVCAFDALTNRTVVVGGHAQVSPTTRAVVREVWEWDGVDWVGGAADVPVDPLGSPIGFGAMVYHERLQGLALVATAWSGGAGTSSDLWIGSPFPASTTSIGTGCGGSTVPALAALGDPWPGNTRFGVDVRSVPANALVVLGFAPAAGGVPIGGGCTLWLQGGAATFAMLANAHGFVHQTVPIPPAPQLVGIELFAQAAGVDATAALGLGLTPALRLRIGN